MIFWSDTQHPSGKRVMGPSIAIFVFPEGNFQHGMSRMRQRFAFSHQKQARLKYLSPAAFTQRFYLKQQAA
jgi:hypothetical protein